MRVLIDTNILIDFIAMRRPFYPYALKIIDACDRKLLHGCVAAHSIPNIYYILRKEVSSQDRKDILKSLCQILTVEALGREQITNALDDSGFSDFEDCLQCQCAAAFSADFIVTRNAEDFSASPIPAISPEDFCAQFLNTEER